MIVLHVKYTYTDRYTYIYLQACSKVVPTLQESPGYLQPCDCLATPLKQARRHDESRVGRLSGKVVTTMSQPCINHATTLLQPYHCLVARLLQG